jgi:hypothetical protein
MPFSILHFVMREMLQGFRRRNSMQLPHCIKVHATRGHQHGWQKPKVASPGKGANRTTNASLTGIVHKCRRFHGGGLHPERGALTKGVGWGSARLNDATLLDQHMRAKPLASASGRRRVLL